MDSYYLNQNRQENGDHEVHKTGCSYFPKWENVERLGGFYTCSAAVAEAKKRHPNAKINGCYYCASSCHTT